jgi:hypothetical protein
MIDPYRFPIVTCLGQGGQEDPPGSADIETRIMDKPPADMDGLTTGQFRQLGNPPAIDLQRAEIMCAVAVFDLRPNPASLLIAKAP